MARYHGKKSRLYLQGSGTDAIPLTTLSSVNIDGSTDMVDVTAFGDGNKTQVMGLASYNLRFDGFWDDTDDTVFQAFEATSGRKFYFYPSTDATSKYWYGLAWVNASIQTGVSAAVAVSGSGAAANTWGRK